MSANHGSDFFFRSSKDIALATDFGTIQRNWFHPPFLVTLAITI